MKMFKMIFSLAALFCGLALMAQETQDCPKDCAEKAISAPECKKDCAAKEACAPALPAKIDCIKGAVKFTGDMNQDEVFQWYVGPKGTLFLVPKGHCSWSTSGKNRLWSTTYLLPKAINFMTAPKS